MAQKLNKTKDILNGLKPLVIDYVKRTKENQERFDVALSVYNESIEKEKIRFNELKCPVCESNNKKEICISENNGVLGPGHRNHIIQQYIVCQDCGIMYVDINKPEKLKYPSKNF